MQNLKLPITLDPYKSAQRRLECIGYIEQSELQRLSGLTHQVGSRIEVEMSFNTDEQNLVVVAGKASTIVSLICQRCAEPFDLPLDIEFKFSPVKNETAADELPSYYDAIELDENGEVNLRTLVEDELLLALPLIPKHEISACQSSGDSTWGELPEELSKPNPFAVLKQLK